MQELKEKYNKTLQRFWRACKWIEAPERTEAEQQKYYKDFVGIMDELSGMLGEFKAMGYEYSNKEATRGFEV